jgi:hypothetical protein
VAGYELLFVDLREGGVHIEGSGGGYLVGREFLLESFLDFFEEDDCGLDLEGAVGEADVEDVGILGDVVVVPALGSTYSSLYL